MMLKDALVPVFYTIQEIQQESHDVFTLTLTPPHNRNIQFKPGQFNMLSAFGVGESAISISSNPNHSDHIAHTIRVIGSVTRNLQKLLPKEPIAVRGPFGTPWPIEPLQQKSILLLAGGIGLAPLRPLIYYLLANRSHFLDIHLVYGARSPDDLIYRAELDAWRKSLNLLVTVNHAPKNWTEHVGVITQHIERLIQDPENTIAILCGPEIMMRFCHYTLRDVGIKPDQIFLSMERNMQCGIGHCGHCQWGPFFICKDGPVMSMKTIEPFFYKKEL